MNHKVDEALTAAELIKTLADHSKALRYAFDDLSGKLREIADRLDRMGNPLD